MNRAVALVNLDNVVAGPYHKMQAMPLLQVGKGKEGKGKAGSTSYFSPFQDLLVDSLKHVEHWDGGGKSLYEDWADWKKEDKPWPVSLASGYDHAPFAFYAGVPGINLLFIPGKSGGYPAYHTGYETFELVDKVVDPGFRIHRSAAQLAMHAALRLAEARVIPFG